MIIIHKSNGGCGRIKKLDEQKTIIHRFLFPPSKCVKWNKIANCVHRAQRQWQSQYLRRRQERACEAKTIANKIYLVKSKFLNSSSFHLLLLFFLYLSEPSDKTKMYVEKKLKKANNNAKRNFHQIQTEGEGLSLKRTCIGWWKKTSFYHDVARTSEQPQRELANWFFSFFFIVLRVCIPFFLTIPPFSLYKHTLATENRR